MVQHGQVFRLKTRRADGTPTWAYRYRVDGRGSVRPQVGGCGSQGEALQTAGVELERLQQRNGRLAQITLSELAEEYLAQHEAEPRTLAKLRWLLAKVTSAFGDRRVVDLRSDEIAAWRTTLPEGHRFEATQALRQLLNREARASAGSPGHEEPARRRNRPRRSDRAWTCVVAAVFPQSSLAINAAARDHDPDRSST